MLLQLLSIIKYFKIFSVLKLLRVDINLFRRYKMDHIPKYAYLFLKFLSEMSQAVKLISNIQIVWIFENLITHEKFSQSK